MLKDLSSLWQKCCEWSNLSKRVWQVLQCSQKDKSWGWKWTNLDNTYETSIEYEIANILNYLNQALKNIFISMLMLADLTSN